MRLFDQDDVLGAIHGPYSDMYWRWLEERGGCAGAGVDIWKITPRHKDRERLLSIAYFWLGQISTAWKVDPWLVFHHLDQELGRTTDKSDLLFELFMGCLGHGVFLGDDLDVHLALERVGKKLGRNLDHAPVHVDETELYEMATDAAEHDYPSLAAVQPQS